MASTDLIELMILVEEKWPFDRANYPQMPKVDPGDPGVTEEIQREWQIRHVLFHIQKSVGALAGGFERVDHGEALSPGLDEAVAIRMLLNCLRLLSLCPEMSSSRIRGMIEEWSHEQRLPPIPE